MQQRTEEWINARLGKLTASRFGDIIGGPEARKRYACEILQEIVTGQPSQDPDFTTPAMDWGNYHEPIAADYYADNTDEIPLLCGFFTHEKYPFVGASPDRLIGFDGLLEIKCPFYTYNHISAIHFGAYAKHKPQVQGQLWVTGRDWCDLASFDPRYHEQPLYIERIQRDEAYIAALEEEVLLFWHCIASRDLNDIAAPKSQRKYGRKLP